MYSYFYEKFTRCQHIYPTLAAELLLLTQFILSLHIRRQSEHSIMVLAKSRTCVDCERRRHHQMEKLLLSKREAAEALGCSVRTIENMIARKQLASRRLGKRRMIPYAALTQLAKRDTLVITGQGNNENTNGNEGPVSV
jgi:excisionase family DNA binding protein